MQVRMNYESFIKLKDFINIIDIATEIVEYEVKNDTLSGKLIVRGKYHKSDLEKEYHFDEDVPFTFVFKDQDFEIIDLDCVNLEYHVVAGRGIEVSFEILVDYEEVSNEVDDNNNVIIDENEEENVTEIPTEVVTDSIPVVNNNLDNNEEIMYDLSEELDQIEEIDENEFNEYLRSSQEDLIEESNTTPVDDEPEEIKTLYTEEIEQRLTTKLNSVHDNLPSDENIIRQIPEVKTLIKVCYYKNDHDLESICINNKVPIDKVFKDNKNTDFTRYHRVIIKQD